MKFLRYIFLCLFVTFVSQKLSAQNPHFVLYDDENGLPSNEVYSITSDEKGFIWFGCDAGLYKFDGVRYIPYKCSTQKSKSVAGLTISPSNRLYCTNFQSQIFYIQNDVLKELYFPYKSTILHITCDQSGQLLVNHSKGFAIYDEKKRTWENHHVFKSIGLNKENQATRSVQVNSKNEACFLTAAGIGYYQHHTFKHNSNFTNEKPTIALSADFMITWFGKEQWIFPVSGQNKIYRCKKGKIELVTSKNLLNIVKGKTITSVKFHADGNFWICTYNGIIRYNPIDDRATVYYSNHAFSDCLIDTEGNYWFTTLQSGIIRVPNLNYTVWNNFQNNKLIRLTCDRTDLYFATVNGDIGSFEFNSQQLFFLQNGNNYNIQTLTYSPENKFTYFYTNKNLYTLQNGKIQLVLANAPPVKDIITVGDQYLICSSHGAYISKSSNELEKIGEIWSREASFDKKTNSLWIATNSGLQKYQFVKGHWKLQRTLLQNRQVLSIDFDTTSGQLFAVTFDGGLYLIQRNGKTKVIDHFSKDVQSYRIQYHLQQVFLATNQGVFIFDIRTKQRKILNKHSGLSSNNVLDLTVVNQTLWLATGKGLQRIPLRSFRSTPKAFVYLKEEKFDPSNVALEYGEPLIIHPEANAYSSNATFEYAYRINGGRIWTRLPGTIDQILLQNIPTGAFEIELKVIDHSGQDSENIILIKGHSFPPFWNTWWFILLEIALFLLIVFFIYKRQLSKKQKELKYQNELNTLKLTAIKSQMNPHFIFNVLSSIKGYIYENDRQRATSYLDDFSDLMRAVLEMSEVHFIPLAEELKLLKLYIELEGMMLEDFSFHLEMDEAIQPDTIQIPSLVLQPYIENAFKHGLRHKQGSKILEIKISSINQNQLMIELNDNGIGRNAAAELNSGNTLKRQSFATQALEKRMSIINEQQQQDIHLEMIDLVDEKGNSAGTRIQLIISKKAV